MKSLYLVSSAVAGIAMVAAPLAGCGASGTGTSAASGTAVPSGTPTPSSTRALTPRQRAEADARVILAAFVPPPGAKELARTPSAGHGALRQPPQSTAGNLVDRAQWWQAPGSPTALLAWENAHLPRGVAGSEGYGTESMGHGIHEWFNAWSLPSVPGVLDSRTLLMAAVIAGHGKADLRVDAQVTWIPARPVTAVIPSAARAVTLSENLGDNIGASAGGRKPPAPVTITDQATVRELAAIIDGLSEFPPGSISCPMDNGNSLTLTFRARPGGAALAVATVGLSGCESVGLTIGGKNQPTLGTPDGGRPLAIRLLKVASLPWKLLAM